MKQALGLITLIGILCSVEAFAGFKVVLPCLRGSNQAEQDANLRICRKQIQEGQKCSTNLWEHGQAAFDVCGMVAKGPLTVVATFKGNSQAEQTANLKLCKSQESSGTVCVTNIWIHKQAAYDVCLMSAADSQVFVPAVVASNPPLATTVSSVKADTNRRFRSNGYSCFNVDVNNRTYGSAVDDSLCNVSYRSNGYSCFNVDVNNRTYGAAVDDSFCHVSYRSNGYSCFNVDVNNRRYGAAVDDSFCHVSYRSNGYNCYNVDMNNIKYGAAVDDSLCHVSYRSNGYNCYNVDVYGKIYGSRVSDYNCNQ